MRDLSDRDLVGEIPENIYYHYFLGLPRYQERAPFDASRMVHFRKRFPQEVINEINELISMTELMQLLVTDYNYAKVRVE